MMDNKPDPEEMDEPPNLPDNLEERAERVFEHVGGTELSPQLNVYPMLDEGPKDTILMLDLMGISQPGTIWERHGRRFVTLDSREGKVSWGPGEYPGASIRAAEFESQDAPRAGTTRIPALADDKLSVVDLWEMFIHDDLQVIGNIWD